MDSFSRLLVVSFLVSASLASAEIYRHVDADGNVLFSDQPQEGATPIEVTTTNIDASPKAPASPINRKADAPDAESYTSLTLVEPANDSTLRQITEVTLVAKPTPALKPGHKLQFLKDGIPLGSASRQTTYTATALTRGSHAFSVAVINAQGERLIRSESATVHIHLRSLLHPAPKTSTRANLPAG